MPTRTAVWSPAPRTNSAATSPKRANGSYVDQRGNGLGARLLAAAEAEIRHCGCDRVTLYTHSLQAPGFYARLGYTECGRTPGYPNGYDHIHLVKRLG
jgi:ribosomal protein S18 acetylase RimI-like enzyme